MLRTAIEILRYLDDFIYSARKTKKILFVLTDGYGFACQAPVIRELQKHTTVNVRTTLDREQPIESISFSSEEDEALFRSLFTPPRLASILKWNFVVDTHQNGFYPKRHALRVYMHHGTGFGSTGTKLPTALGYHLYFGLSKAQKNYYERLSPGIFDSERAFFSVGSPKTDEFAQCRFNRQQLIKKYGLHDQATILITSHWNANSTLSNFGGEVLSRLAETFPQYNIIQTGHPWLWSDNKHVDQEFQKELWETLTNIERRFENAYFLPGATVFELLSLGNLLVADHSSVITTYSLLDRPIVFFDNPLAKKEKIGVPEIIDTYRKASHQFTTLDSLVSSCETAISEPERRASGRKMMRETFSANVGKSSDIASQILAESTIVFNNNSLKWKEIMRSSQKNMSQVDLIPVIDKA